MSVMSSRENVEWEISCDGVGLRRGQSHNLVTQVGDRLYAERGAAIASPPATPTGMKLGNGSTAAAKSGAGAALTTYLDNSHLAFDSTYPHSALSGSARRITYLCTFGPGKATSTSPITEAVIVNDTLGNATSAEAATISRALLTGIGSKGSGETLTVTWTHDVMGSFGSDPVPPDPVPDPEDGSSGASGGPAQKPTLLSGYAHRPPWMVAGVDYAVGVRPGTVLRVPTSGNLPAGAELGTGGLAGVLYINGHNVTLSAFDVTGLTVYVNDTATGTATLVDCKMDRGNIRSVTTPTCGLVIRYCTLNGGGLLSSPDFHVIKVWTNPLVVEWCVVCNGAAGIQCPEPVTWRYNLLFGFAWVTGAHAAATACQATGDSAATALIAYNTVYCSDSRDVDGFPIGMGTGLASYNDAGGSLYNITVANNTLVANLPGGASYMTGFYADLPGTATGIIRDNYFASVNGYNGVGSGAFGPIYKNSLGNVTATYTGNIDMTTGASVN